MNLPRRRLLLMAAVISLALAGVLTGSASAASSRELVNGFDNEYHCSSSNDGTSGECSYFNTMMPWLRGGAPDPTKPVLVLDRDGTTDPDCVDSCNESNNPHVIELDNALDLAFGAGVFNKQLVDPRSPEFAALPLDTAHYSALVVASDVNCGGCDLNNPLAQPDSDALAARKADILNFFHNGGGVMAFSGGGVNSKTPSPSTRGGSGTLARCNHYYDFLPLAAFCDAGGGGVTTTPAGQGIGLQDSFYGSTHNVFLPPAADSPLQIGAVTDNSDNAARGTLPAPQPQTLFADVPLQPTIASAGSAAACTGSFQSSDAGGSGTKAIHYKVGGGAEQVVATDAAGNAAVTFAQGTTSVEFWAEDAAGNQEATHHTLAVTGCAKPAAPTIGVAGVRRACTSASSIHVRISVTAPGTIKTVKVTLDGKTIKTTTKGRFTLRINMKKLKAGRHRLRTVVTDQAGNTKVSTRTLARCAAAKPRKKAAPRFTG